MFKASFVAGLTSLASAYTWTEDEAYISLHLSNYAYCGHSAYDTLNFGQTPDTAGFVVTDVIYNPLKDTEGFVGYLPSNESIYVVFRGSSSILNWVTNLNTDKALYKIWPECECQVHDGFQTDFLSVANTVATAVNRLAWKYPHYAIKTTGHSLGAALGHHAGMYLLKNGYTGVTMINFGQPRLGDDKYAAFAKTTWPSKWRNTHCKDTVPHIPLEDMGFEHTDTEMY